MFKKMRFFVAGIIALVIATTAFASTATVAFADELTCEAPNYPEFIQNKISIFQEHYGYEENFEDLYLLKTHFDDVKYDYDEYTEDMSAQEYSNDPLVDELSSLWRVKS